MRQKCATIDSVVETIVDAHHGDFYESYKTYSVTLERFSKAKEHLTALRRHLMLAQAQVRPDTERLRALYHRDLMLKDVQRLLQDALSVSSLPERIDALIKKKDWSQATSLLIQGSNVLARDEMVQVKGLRHLRDDLADRRTELLKILTCQVEQYVYERSQIDFHASTVSHHLPMSVGNLGVRSLPRPARPLHRQGSDALAAASTGIGGKESASQTTPVTSRHRRSATYGGPGERVFPNLVHQQTPHKFHSRPPSGTDSMLEDFENVAIAAECIAQLGGIALVLVSLRRQMPVRLRRVILDAVVAFSRLPSSSNIPRTNLSIEDETGIAELQASPATGLVEAVFKQCIHTMRALMTAFEQLAATKSPAPSAGMSMHLHRDAAELGCSVTDLLPPQGNDDDDYGGDYGGVNVGRAKWAGIESAKAWECLQIECQKFLSLVLEVSTDNAHDEHNTFRSSHQNSAADETDGVHGTSSPQSSRWWWSFSSWGLHDNSNKPSRSVTFSFAVEEEARQSPKPVRRQPGSPDAVPFLISQQNEVNELQASNSTRRQGAGTTILQLTNRGGWAYDQELAKGIARAIPWRRHTSTKFMEPTADVDARLVSLVAAVYKPTMNFVDTAQKALPRSARTQDAAVLNAVLKSYLDDVVRSHFLPAVFLLARAWSRRVLDGADALKPRSRPRGAAWPIKSATKPTVNVHLSSPLKTRSASESFSLSALLLPAAVGTAALTNRLLSLAASVPPFVTHLAGVLENVLDQVLLVFQASISTEWGGSAALMLSDDVRIVHILAQEKGATALGGPMAFYVKQGDTVGQAMGNAAALMDSFLSSAIAAGFGSSTKPLNRELLEAMNAVLAQQKAMTAVASAARYIQLASLAEAADHIADVVSTAASAAAFQFQKDKQEEKHHLDGEKLRETPRRAGEAWRRRHLSHAPQSMTVSDLTGGLVDSLTRAADRFRGLAGRCIRTLRLDLAVLTVSQLSFLKDLCPSGQTLPDSHGNGNGNGRGRDVMEEQMVRDLGRVVTQLDEETKRYLPPERRAYVFGSVAPFAMQVAISLLPRLSEQGIKLDARCVSRICRALSSLQPSLSSVGEDVSIANNGRGKNDSNQKRQLEKAKLYYSLLLQPPEALIAAATSKPHRFSISEYEALLNATVIGRPVSAVQKARLREALRQSLGDVEGSNM